MARRQHRLGARPLGLRAALLAAAAGTSRSAEVAAGAVSAEAPATAAAAAGGVLSISVGEQCGITGTVGPSGFVEFGHGRQVPVCQRVMSTNCSVAYNNIRCPRACPYLSPNPAFSCLFECVPAEECSRSNTNLPYPDPLTHLCSKCTVHYCKRCGQSNRCSECHDGFAIAANGTRCAFELQRKVCPDLILRVAMLVLGVLAALSMFWWRAFGRPSAWTENDFAIKMAMRHRHRVKVQNWSLEGVLRQRYPLTVNLHYNDILGVGVSLFYNNLCFLMVVAFIFTLATFAVNRMSDLGRVIEHLEHRRSSLLEGAVALPGAAPALLISPLHFCGRTASGDVQAALLRFGDSNVVALGLLYAALFAGSLLHGAWQKRHARSFDAKNTSMSDYAIALRGLPAAATDEEALAAWLEGELAGALPAGRELRLRGVSIAYAYPDRAEEVEAMVFRLTERHEVGLGCYRESHTSAAAEGKSLAQKREEDRRAVQAWFQEGSREQMYSSGVAFAVFRRKTEKYAVLKYCREHPGCLRHPSLPGAAVAVEDVYLEPVSLWWCYYGITWRRLVANACRAAGRLSLTILAVSVLVVYPFARFVLYPFVRTGAAAEGHMFAMAGCILGWVNMMTSIQIYFVCSSIGFAEEDKRNTVIFWANLLVTFLNTCFNVGVTTVMIVSRHNPEHEVFFTIRSLAEMGTQHFLARDIHFMMIPGAFFNGPLMCPIMAGLLPYLWNMLLMKVIYSWGCLPRPLLRLIKLMLPWAPASVDRYPARLAERGLEPPELGLPWDYAGSIVMPTVCFTMLFLVSPYVWKTFLGLFAWAIFSYGFCRYMHLRFFKAHYYTSRRLDAHANLAWGIPLSMVAAAWCVWALRAGRFGSEVSPWGKWMLVVASFLLSLLLWVLSYRFLVNPWRDSQDRCDEEDATVEQAQAQTLYSWFNCNPVYTLKRAFLSGKGGQTDDCMHFFEVGKEHIFFPAEKQVLLEESQNDSLEFETYADAAVNMVSAPLNCRCGAAPYESLPQRPAAEQEALVASLVQMESGTPRGSRPASGLPVLLNSRRAAELSEKARRAACTSAWAAGEPALEQGG